MSGDAIIAIATAPGRGGIGVIRISIPTRTLASEADIQAFTHRAFSRSVKPRYAHHAVLTDASGDALDEGLLMYFPAPASFTGEHVLEFQGHGGPALLKLCLQRLLELTAAWGSRLARPGEFTERAFLNGKLDLTQAEAVADLIDAGSERAARAAMGSLRGAFSERVHALAESVLTLRMLVEATLDFPEEEIEFLQQSDALGRLASCRSQLANLLTLSRQTARVASGFKVVLAGQPNVGKSSLLNALSGEDRAIVTPIAGTTRDSIHQELELEGVRITLIDTAGLRQTDDPVERIGIERARQEIVRADVLLLLLDASLPEPNIPPVLETIDYRGPRLTVVNKCDQLVEPVCPWPLPDAVLLVSALTGFGLDALRTALFDTLQCDPHAELPFLARERHIVALERTAFHLNEAALHAEQADSQLDLFAEALRLAHDALGEITGRVLPDDLLGFIFSRFCIGK